MQKDYPVNYCFSAATAEQKDGVLHGADNSATGCCALRLVRHTCLNQTTKPSCMQCWPLSLGVLARRPSTADNLLVILSKLGG
jgi:hypothetical protein